MHDRNHQTTGTMQFFALLIQCPFGEPKGQCPFHSIRSRFACLENRFRLAEQLAGKSDQAHKLWQHHTECYTRRLARVNLESRHRLPERSTERYATC